MKQFEEMLEDRCPALQEVARGARALVMEVQPGAHQEVYPGWGGYLLFKAAAGTGNTVCHLSVHERHVTLSFPQGTELPDPGGLLQGNAKRARHVKLKSEADLARPELRALVEAAWGQQPTAAVQLDSLERVRRICLAFPDTRETVSHGHPTFWAGKKTFAVFGIYAPSVAFKADFELHEELADHPLVFPTPYMARNGFLSIKLDADTDWQLVHRLLDHSYRQVATKRRP